MDLQTVNNAARDEVLRRYGFEKVAENPVAWLFREHPEAYNRWYTAVPEMAREVYLGSPVTHGRLMRDTYRRTQSVPGTYKELAKAFYYPKATDFSGKAMRALGLGLTAMDLYSAVANGPANRYGDLSAAVTNLALNPLTARGGLLMAPLHAGVVNLARRAGHHFDPPNEEPPFIPAPTVGSTVRRTIRGMPMAGSLSATGAEPPPST